MLLSETLLIALGTSAAKYLAKELLPKEWQDEIGTALIGAGITWVTTREPADPIGKAIGQRTQVIYDGSRLSPNEKLAVAYEVTRTLALANTDLLHLMAIDLNADALSRELIETRPEVDQELSADGLALYRQMLRVAAEGMIETVDQHRGFLRVAIAQLLYRQTAQGQQQEDIRADLGRIYDGLGRWLREPEERAEAFRVRYQEHLSEQLDRMEPFGIPKRKKGGQGLRLRNAFVGLYVRYQPNRQLPYLLLRALRNQGHNFAQLPDNLKKALGEMLARANDGGPPPDEMTQFLEAFLTEQGRLPGGAWPDVPDMGGFPGGKSGARRSSGPHATEGDWRQSLRRLVAEESEARDTPFEKTFSGERRIMLEGNAGSGKSSLLQWLAVMAAQRDFPDSMAGWNGLIPFFIRLRACSGEFPAPESWPSLEAKPIAGTMPERWVHDQLESGRALVLIDGVDEMPRNRREGLLRELRGLVNAYPLARYVVSSRPPAVNEKQWPEWRTWLKEEAFAEVSLQEMDDRQLLPFIARWHAAYAEYARSVGNYEAGEAAERNAPRVQHLLSPGRRDDLRKLARTPLLGAMICAMYQERGENIPRERLKLYEECVLMLLERREQEKKVDLAADYIALSESEKIALLRAFAYWMMDNQLTTVDVGEAGKRFEAYLPRLGRSDNAPGARVIELFVERASLLQEEAADEISFRHRTFQEYLAADSAVFEGNIGALVAKSHDDQWRETIILAFGMANRKGQEVLLRGIIGQAQTIKDARARSQRRLLALACLETGIDVDPNLRQEVLNAAAEIFPPRSDEEAKLIAKAGTMAIDLLSYDPNYPATIAVYSIHALTAIGGEAALKALAEYATSEEERIHQALASSWDGFDRDDFAGRILALSSKWSFSRLPAHPGWAEQLAHVKTLEISASPEDDLSPLAGLSGLSSLELELPASTAVDLGPLAGLSGLSSLVLDFPKATAVDLGPLASLTGLSSLGIDFPEATAVDLSPLADSAGLSSLGMKLSGVTAVDLSPLAGLAGLSSLGLGLGGATEVDLSSLAGLFGLSSLVLDLRGATVVDLNPLVGLVGLSALELNFPEARAVDLGPLASLAGLSSLVLELGWATEVDLSPLAGLTGLSLLVLDLGWAAAVDLGSLAGLSGLASLRLNLASASEVDLSPLAGLSGLSSLVLDLGWAAAVDLGPLADLTELSLLGLFLLNATAVDLTPLAGLAGLSTLELKLSGVTVVDLGPLGNMTGLSSLGLGLGKVKAVDLSPLAGLSNLTSLELRGDTAADLRPLAGLSNLASLALYGDTAVDLSPLAGLSNLASLALWGGKVQQAVALLRPLSRRRGLYIFEMDPHINYLLHSWDNLERVSLNMTYLPARE